MAPSASKRVNDVADDGAGLLCPQRGRGRQRGPAREDVRMLLRNQAAQRTPIDSKPASMDRPSRRCTITSLSSPDVTRNGAWRARMEVTLRCPRPSPDHPHIEFAAHYHAGDALIPLADVDPPGKQYRFDADFPLESLRPAGSKSSICSTDSRPGKSLVPILRVTTSGTRRPPSSTRCRHTPRARRPEEHPGRRGQPATHSARGTHERGSDHHTPMVIRAE